MPTPFTKTLEFSRQLLRLYQTEGRDAFVEVITHHTQALQRDKGSQPEALNSILMTLLSGMLSVLLGGQPDEIIRQQVSISEHFINAPDGAEKVHRFVRELMTFLDLYDEEQKKKEFSEQVLYRLSTCSLPEIRNATVTSVAERFGYHPNYFSSKFRKEQGERLQDAISRERLNRAFFLLKEERQLSVSHVAREVGFTDVKYFGVVFKKRFGFPPSQIP